MSTKKLEPAIDRMLVSVSNRLETDKVEQVIAEREIEAEERAEEERLRKAWQQETENAKAQGTTQTVTTTVEKIRIIQRRPTRKALDFDFPFNDDDDGSQEPSHLDALRQQKLIFESQRADRGKMIKASIASGGTVYSRMFQRSKAIAWAKKKAAEAARTKKQNSSSVAKDGEVKGSKDDASSLGDKADKDREQINELNAALGREINAALGRVKLMKKKKTKAKPLVFD